MIIDAEGMFEAIRFRVESMRRGELLPEDNFYPDLQKAIDEDTLPKDGRKEDDYHPPVYRGVAGKIRDRQRLYSHELSSLVRSSSLNVPKDGKTDDDPEAA